MRTIPQSSIDEMDDKADVSPLNEPVGDYSATSAWSPANQWQQHNEMQTRIQHDRQSSEASPHPSYPDDPHEHGGHYDSLVLNDRLPDKHDERDDSSGAERSSMYDIVDEERAYEYEYPRYDARLLS